MPKLHWIGREQVVQHHRDVPVRALDLKYNYTAPSETPANSNGNRIIHGDNLDALKSLLPEFEGRVNCIYIDPPYNTGNEEWRYNDAMNDPKMKRWLDKVVGKEGEDLTRHDKWLCMMYPRLKLLHRLLAEDGVIFVSIDDNEQAHLKLVMDEIFGANNFISQIVWEKGRKNDAKLVSTGHEYMILYAANKRKLNELNVVWREAKLGTDEILREYKKLRQQHGENFKLIEDDLSVFYKSLRKEHPSKKHARYCRVDQFGVWRDDNMSWPGGGGPTYDVFHPETGEVCAVPSGGWRYSTPEKMQEMIDSGKVVFRKDHTESPIRKTYLLQASEEEADDESAVQVAGSYFYRSALQATTELSNLLGKNVFDYPKDSEVLSRWIRYATNKNAIVLDSFAGSGTTAHAVLKLNAQDGGNRRFILVETMDYAETITAERVRRVMRGYGEGNKAVAGLGGSFDFYQVGVRLFDDFGHLNPAAAVPKIRAYIAWQEGLPLDDLSPSDHLPVPSSNQPAAPSPYWLGTAHDSARYFCYEPNEVVILDFELLATLQITSPRSVIYADVCTLGPQFMAQRKISFKKIPRDIAKL